MAQREESRGTNVPNVQSSIPIRRTIYIEEKVDLFVDAWMDLPAAFSPFFSPFVQAFVIESLQNLETKRTEISLLNYPNTSCCFPYQQLVEIQTWPKLVAQYCLKYSETFRNGKS